MARPFLLVPIFILWAVACVALGAVFRRRAPAVSLAMVESLLGAVVGFLIGNADGPAEVPTYTAVGASLGLFAGGLGGLVVTSARPPSSPLLRAALLAVITAPVAAGALTLLLQVACRPYVNGKRSGFCNYQGADLLGAWLTGVVVAFSFDAVFVALLFLASAWQARGPDLALTGIVARRNLPRWLGLVIAALGIGLVGTVAALYATDVIPHCFICAAVDVRGGTDVPLGTGPAWTNARTGQVAGPNYVGVTVPFETSNGCGSEEFTSSISWRRGWYIQNWTGPKGMVIGTYRELASLPDGGVFTGWEREGERLWKAPNDVTSPGKYTYLYVQRPDHVERWPRANFGCA